MTLHQVVESLQRLKGEGAWIDIARSTGIHYDTVARIARGAIKNPGIGTVEKLAAALALVERREQMRV